MEACCLKLQRRCTDRTPAQLSYMPVPDAPQLSRQSRYASQLGSCSALDLHRGAGALVAARIVGVFVVFATATAAASPAPHSAAPASGPITTSPPSLQTGSETQRGWSGVFVQGSEIRVRGVKPELMASGPSVLSSTSAFGLTAPASPLPTPGPHRRR